ncbi:MAG: sulfur carrier protein ThiS [Methanomassiliicoccaceae archaeon]|nr:sulfur carrier protein ThiS [Methanomassiliicoccaceae archaeon]
MKVNGIDEGPAAAKTVSDLIRNSGLREDRVAVEVNGNIVPRSDYSITVLKDDDSVEIVGFVGGG